MPSTLKKLKKIDWLYCFRLVSLSLCLLTLILPIFFVLKMSSAFYVLIEQFDMSPYLFSLKIFYSTNTNDIQHTYILVSVQALTCTRR